MRAAVCAPKNAPGMALYDADFPHQRSDTGGDMHARGRRHFANR